MTPDPIPSGYTTVTPWIVGPDSRATMAFMQAAFGAEELACLEQDGVVAHAEMRVGDAIVMLFDAGPAWPATPALLRLFVPDGQATYAAAIEAGATSITSVTHLAFGDRVARVRDPQGNLWWIQQRVEDVAPDEMANRWTDPRWSAKMAYVQQSLSAAFSG